MTLAPAAAVHHAPWSARSAGSWQSVCQDAAATAWRGDHLDVLGAAEPKDQSAGVFSYITHEALGVGEFGPPPGVAALRLPPRGP